MPKTKQLITRPHLLRGIPVGIEVGWRVFDKDDKPFESWWGSTRDENTLDSLIADLRHQGEVFEYEHS